MIGEKISLSSAARIRKDKHFYGTAKATNPRHPNLSHSGQPLFLEVLKNGTALVLIFSATKASFVPDLLTTKQPNSSSRLTSPKVPTLFRSKALVRPNSSQISRMKLPDCLFWWPGQIAWRVVFAKFRKNVMIW